MVISKPAPMVTEAEDSEGRKWALNRIQGDGDSWSGLVWSGLVWSGLVWSGLVWSAGQAAQAPLGGASAEHLCGWECHLLANAFLQER